MIKKRIRYRDKKGNLKHDTIVNFSDLDRVDKEGNFIPFEPTSEDNFLASSTSYPPKFWFEIYKKLTGLEAVVILCIYQWEMTQEQVGDYLGISQNYVSRHYKSAMKKLKKFCLDK